ncbi:CLUMA_CG010757, isoform A [Clunio marinus]|uniref:CLUMA_CG010757, isoform A n=1 Tax=Clunio marinus TaxID=568069 RepID=A0A1J1IEE0_9DIPT|nr:CLUMA_CG010757, isoform A [Clunio marinus]
MIDMRQFSILVVVTVRLFICYAAISTELVEEWGCYESEFKLTCNHIDSTVGILEATFTPNCEGSNGKSNKLCLLLIQNYDEGQNSIMKVIAQSLGNKLEHEEEAAARRLLEVLRNARLKEQEQEENEARTSEYRSEINTTDIYDMTTFNENETSSVDYEMSPRNDKRTLRNSLEKLISLYLTKLREDSTEYNLIDDEDSDSSSNERERRDLGLRKNRRRKLIPGRCKTMRRRIGTLDANEIENSLRNFTSSEFNIRKLLNYRCSGKNHCSFIFATDHPYAMFWEKGTVHIKYICMDGFRVNKYCGELLNIGNEVTREKSNNEHTREHLNDSEENLTEPIAQARIHFDQNFHQFTNLKIIKAEKSERQHNASQQPVMPRAKNNSEVKMLKIFEKDKIPNKVYSQDYKVLKVLPNELPKDPDIEKVKKEEYLFKKDEVTPVDSNIATNEIDSEMPTDAVPKESNTTEPFMEIISSIVDPTISNEIDRNPQGTTDGLQIMIIERKDLAKTVTHQAPVELNVLPTPDGSIDEMRAKIEDVTVFSNEIDYSDNEKYVNLSNSGVLEGSVFDTFRFEEDDKDNDSDSEITSDEDYSTEIINPTSPTFYSSRQRSMPSSTLLHGFITNPGYPSFYIGKNNECRSRLNLTDGQSIALTILDLHLRLEDYCKDSLEIYDVISRRTLFRGCSDLSRPIRVQSTSNSVEILLRTKSRSIYPKRGFLIHYKAVGCILPSTPSKVILDYNYESQARFICQPKHVFPDSSQPERVLQCENETWNDTLVNCVELEEVHGSGPVDLWFNDRLRKDNRMSSGDESMFDDILLPIFIVSGLFILNAIVFIVIIRYRKLQRRESLDRELADL